jgi:hypothetical protein
VLYDDPLKGYSSFYPRDDIPNIEVYPDGQTTPTPNYLLIETAFTVVQWLMVGPLTTLAIAGTDRKVPAVT